MHALLSFSRVGRHRLHRLKLLPHLLLCDRHADPVECFDTVADDAVGDEPLLFG